jgi:hypothetical protein
MNTNYYMTLEINPSSFHESEPQELCAVAVVVVCVCVYFYITHTLLSKII